jgi:predicted transposase YdaD
MFELSDLKQTRVYQEALAEGEERGLERGLEQGLERGLEQGERLVVENLLRVRFGELDPEIQAIISRILQLSPEEFTPFTSPLFQAGTLKAIRCPSRITEKRPS